MAMSEPLALILQPDNPCNTRLVDSDSGDVVYTVVTENTKERAVTRVVKTATGETIASWEWRDIRSDIITLGSAPPVSSSAWLRKSMIPFKDTVYLDGPEGKKYKWKGNGPGMSFELYTEGDKTSPIARFVKSRLIRDRTQTPSTEERTPSKLLLDPRGEQIQDLVVISFLVLEKSRRARENSTLNSADGAGRAFGAGVMG